MPLFKLHPETIIAQPTHCVKQ